MKRWKQRVSIEKGFGFGLYGRIKFIRTGFYDRDGIGNYFLFISILKLRKTILKLYDKFRKENGNNMTAVAVTLNAT